MVFQSFNLWSHLTVLENLNEGPVHVQKRPRAECAEEARAALAKVGIADKWSHYPAHLSGGQQQRAAIARARDAAKGDAVRRADLGVRSGTSRRSAARDARARRGGTILVVTHEMGFARDVSSRVMFLHQGLVEAERRPRELFSGSTSERFREFISKERG
jgi:octopine/nopaline transport system ATP-binding protein